MRLICNDTQWDKFCADPGSGDPVRDSTRDARRPKSYPVLAEAQNDMDHHLVVVAVRDAQWLIAASKRLAGARRRR
jgi:hypothetical protein